MTKLSYFSLQPSPIQTWHWEIHQQKFWLETVVTKHESPFRTLENPKSTPQLTLYVPYQPALVPSSLNFLFHQVFYWGRGGVPISEHLKWNYGIKILACLGPSRTTAEWASVVPKKLRYRSAPSGVWSTLVTWKGHCILFNASTSTNTMELTLVTNTR